MNWERKFRVIGSVALSGLAIASLWFANMVSAGGSDVTPTFWPPEMTPTLAPASVDVYVPLVLNGAPLATSTIAWPPTETPTRTSFPTPTIDLNFDTPTPTSTHTALPPPQYNLLP